MNDLLSTGQSDTIGSCVESSIANTNGSSLFLKEDDCTNFLTYSDLTVLSLGNLITHDVNASSRVISNRNDGVVNHRLASRQWSKTVKSLLQPSRSAFLLLHGPAITLLLTLITWLFATTNFQSQQASFDFGPNYGRIESDGSPLDNNIAFGLDDANSVGHFFQGFVAAFLSFPAVSRLIARKFGSIGMG